ncbi:MAG: DNA-processing protein DprA [Deltaproteobacteria bacterium]|nr:DNA-processing protein DprA [Deltaproteobacteria bacterium]
MELAQEVLKLSAGDVSRFVTLRDRLSDPAFNMADTPFLGWDKFREIEFEYALYHVKPPEHLFLRGRSWQILNATVSISFGGTVSPTADGFQLSELLAQQAVLGHRAVVGGGGVIGVDMAAHLGALDAKGSTIAVLANPVTHGLHPYEPKRTFLEEGIIQQGGLLASEYDSPEDDRKERLLQRDRVITALSDFFVAVECSKDSGTVDAAKRAKIQGKKVVVIDWSKIRHTWHEPKTSGALQLIQEKVAEALPCEPVSDIRDPRLMQEFHELLTGDSAA